MYMQAKPSKCHTVALKSSTGRLFNHMLKISGHLISHNDASSINFLPRPQHPDTTQLQHNLDPHTKLSNMLLVVDACPLTIPEVETLQSCYLPSLVLADNDRGSTLDLGGKELGSNGLTLPQMVG